MICMIVRFLMNNKPDLTEADLKELLLDNEVGVGGVFYLWCETSYFIKI
jgi:hypothetical protein